MKTEKGYEWSRLDNAAKIFPPTSDERDTKVFRFACELYETVDADTLQMALDETVEAFPIYRSVIKRGMFWYYFESRAVRPMVSEEDEPPCSPLYDPNWKDLLFRVTYFEKRINLEVYHALSDATGALNFLHVLLFHYLTIKHEADFKDRMPVVDYDASMSQKMADSFQKYYEQEKKGQKTKQLRAYKIKGSRVAENRLKVITGVMPVSDMLRISKEYGTTLTVFLAAVLLCAIHEEMPVRYEKYPVVLTVPVNLRNYFDSETARNFFGVINVGYNFEKESGKFEDMIRSISEIFKQELTETELAKRMNHLSSLEHNAFARIIPLALKDISLWSANRLNERGITAALSNIGKIKVSDELRPYIRRFDVCASTRRLQVCVCSYENNLSITFTAPFLSTDIQRRFFRTLTGMDIPVEISANQVDE